MHLDLYTCHVKTHILFASAADDGGLADGEERAMLRAGQDAAVGGVLPPPQGPHHRGKITSFGL